MIVCLWWLKPEADRWPDIGGWWIIASTIIQLVVHHHGYLRPWTLQCQYHAINHHNTRVLMPFFGTGVRCPDAKKHWPRRHLNNHAFNKKALEWDGWQNQLWSFTRIPAFISCPGSNLSMLWCSISLCISKFCQVCACSFFQLDFCDCEQRHFLWGHRSNHTPQIDSSWFVSGTDGMHRSGAHACGDKPISTSIITTAWKSWHAMCLKGVRTSRGTDTYCIGVCRCIICFVTWYGICHREIDGSLSKFRYRFTCVFLKS